MPHGDIECGQIIVDKLAPFSFSSEIETTLLDFLDVRSILLAESQDGVHDSVRYLKIIEIRSTPSLRLSPDTVFFAHIPKPARLVVIVGIPKAILSSGVYPHGS